MKFGVSSYVWVSPFSMQTIDQLQKAHNFGFDVYEIGVEDPSSFSPELIYAEAQRIGIQVNICGAFGQSRDISSDNEVWRNEGCAYIRTLIDYAVITHSPYVAGPMYSATGKARLLSVSEKKKQMQYVITNIRELCEYAYKKNIKLAIEPLNRYETDCINTVEQGLELIEKVGADNLGFLLDVYHMNIEEKKISEAILMAKDKIFDFHACANDRGIPGNDHLDWKGIAEALRRIRYDGPVVIESFTTAITEIARAVSLWRPVASSQDELACRGLAFLKETFK
ncbi:sugar phosphate isomerase/epimerase [Treponema sp. OMZ 840]|uniref:sugar phosphate isomerase/epimerase family protein n=1 Tax=Treponema sp. OMZ 840 TaxID=244313 RepID=UPI003D89E7F9